MLLEWSPGYQDYCNIILIAITRHVTQGLLEDLVMVPLPAALYTIPLLKQTRLDVSPRPS